MQYPGTLKWFAFKNNTAWEFCYITFSVRHYEAVCVTTTRSLRQRASVFGPQSQLTTLLCSSKNFPLAFISISYLTKCPRCFLLPPPQNRGIIKALYLKFKMFWCQELLKAWHSCLKTPHYWGNRKSDLPVIVAAAGASELPAIQRSNTMHVTQVLLVTAGTFLHQNFAG